MAEENKLDNNQEEAHPYDAFGDSLEVSGISDRDLNAFIREATGKDGAEMIVAKPVNAQPVKVDRPKVSMEPVAIRKNSRISRIESILEEGLDTVCFGMPADKQVLFSGQGEKTAQEILMVLESVADKKIKIPAIIRKWLSIVTGVNKYFLEQEIKIKTDEIIKLS